MQQFREAKTEEELKKVKTLPFDINFFNLEDPKVFKAMTDPVKGEALWRKTYGFDFAKFVPGQNGSANILECHKDCMRAEYGKFAQDCAKDGGFFKCCILG